MREFFLSQMDFVFFVYGLGFIFLAAMAFFVWRMKSRQGFWKWIALFGVLHGMTEWMDMVAISFPSSLLFKDIRVIFLTLSFVCFVELVRVEMAKRYPRAAGLWVYAPLLLLVVGGGLYLNGASGVNVLARYVFGVLGGLLSTWFIWRIGRKDPLERQFFAVFCCLLAGYVCTQLATPKAGFWPASVFNQDVFLNWAQVPIQALRMALAVILAILLSRYYFRERKKLFPLTSDSNRVFYSTDYLAVIFCTLILVGWGFTTLVTHYKKIEESEDILAVVKTMASGIDHRRLDRLAGVPEDRDTFSYVRIKELIDAMFLTEERMDDVHLWGMRQGKITLLLDVDRDETRKALEKTDPHGIYSSQRKDLIAVFNNSEIAVQEPLYSKSSGFVSMFVPVQGLYSNRLSGVFEFSMDADEWKVNLYRQRLFPVSITLFLVTMTLVFLIIYRREQESKQAVQENERKYFALSVELDEERDKLQTIFDASHVGLLLVDAQINVVRVNSVVADMVHKSIDEILGDRPGNILGCVHAEAAPGGCGSDIACVECPIFSAAKQVLATGESLLNLEVEQTLRNASGELHKVWFEINATPIYINRVRHALFVLSDITHRKRMEAGMIEAKELADAANRAKSDFIANMSHEIRTPMNAILGFSELLNRTEISDKQKAYLVQIMSGGKILLTIINDILDISKISSGKMVLENAEFDLYALIDDTLSMGRSLVNSKPVEFKSVLNELVPRRVSGDALRLRQILTNLLGNAVKFTPKGEIVLSVSRIEHADQKDKVELYFTIKDTGIGIAAEKLDDIFMPFVQEDMSTTKQFGGTGLGLAICQQLVNMMDGRIWVSSQPGKGSEFTFTVTLHVTAEALPDKKAPVIEKQQDEDLKGMKILLAEDSLPNQELMKAYFETLGCAVDYASNGFEALELLREGRVYDLCLMDVQMPVMDGITATRIIHQEIDKDFVIIALTAGAMKGDAAHCFQAGMTDYLSKPVNFDILKAKLIKYKKRGLTV
ncbi:MAG: response regulator [Candidatus Omnitrophica bacterium]|nr:response regulator [Candidatus Omnitrophota bacterium]